MRTGEAFILGTVTGAVVGWLWGRQIADSVGGATRGMRARAAAGIRAVEEKTEQVLDRGEKSLQRAEAVLQHTKEHVGEVLRAGEDAIRPAPAARKA